MTHERGWSISQTGSSTGQKLWFSLRLDGLFPKSWGEIP